MMSSAKKVLLVEHGATSLTYNVIICLGQSLHYELHVLSFGSLKNPFYKRSKYVKTYTFFNNYNKNDYDLAFEIIKETALKINADIVLPIMEQSVDTISRRLPEILAIAKVPPLPTPEIFDQVINKWLLYSWLYENKYSNIKPLLFSDLLEKKVTREHFSLPFLIKPFWGSDGQGITQIKTEYEYDRIFTKKWPNKEFLLIQPFIEGYDIDISFLAADGRILSYAIQKSIADEKKFKYSRNIIFVKDERLLELTARIVDKLKFSGVAHLDYRYDTHRSTYELVDFNCRYWSSILGSLNAGINFPVLSCQRAMGMEISHPAYLYDKYFETNNVFRILFNTIFKSGYNFPTLHNSQFKYYWKDPILFLYYIYNLIQAKINWILHK